MSRKGLQVCSRTGCGLRARHGWVKGRAGRGWFCSLTCLLGGPR